MTRLEKCKLLKSNGYTYNPETGEIYGMRGKLMNRKDKGGYIILKNHLRAHHFAWYWVYGNVDFNELDHKNNIPDDNKIDNLRIVTSQQNKFNRRAKGYTWDKNAGKWKAQIELDGKNIYLGYYSNKDDARNAYLKAKDIYHIIE